MATNAPATVADRLPKQGEVLTSGEHSYRLDVVLGSGAYGTVFLCYDDKGTKLAAKVEKYSKSYISTEVQVLKMANNRQCKHFCKFIDSKTLKPEYVFLVMSLAGKNLHELRAQQPEKKFSMITGLRVGLQTLEALRELHECGFVSRDVKPGNFAPGIRANGQTKTILIFDFGLAKTFRDKNGNLQPSRGVIGWRGTTRYGSLMVHHPPPSPLMQAHQRVDLSRRDDVESWYYLLVEVTKGNLPWRLLTVREGVEKAKRMARTSMREQFLYGCPSEFGELLPIIDGLKFEDEPPYDAIMALLGTALKKAAGGQETALGLDSEDTKWDWDAEVAEDTSTRTECSGSDEKDAGEGGVDDLKKVPAVPVEPKTKPETPEATPRAATTDDKKTTPAPAAP